MNAAQFYAVIQKPATAWFQAHCPTVPINRAVEVLLLAIVGQEAVWTYRVQLDGGYAHGFWQFETIGIQGVLGNRRTQALVYPLIAAAGVTPPTTLRIWDFFALPEGDNLAFAFARLNLWVDPAPLPPIGDAEANYRYYDANWGPGADRADAWPSNYAAALAAIPEVTA
jgi:hypothetical protein